MSREIEQVVGNEFQSVQEVIAGLTQLEGLYRDVRDRRAVFVTAYLQMTREIQKQILNALFHDGNWVSHYIVSFANLYRRALYHYEKGEMDSIPKCWKTSLDISSHKTGLIIQDLILGINAHINRDLPLALLEVSVDPNRSRKHEDHTSVNRIIEAITDRIQDRISDFYSSGLGVLDKLLGRLDEKFTSFSSKRPVSMPGGWGWRWSMPRMTSIERG